MSLRFRPTLLAVLFCAGANAWGQYDDLEVTLTPAAREYCHIIQFPEAWAMPRTDAKTGEPLHLGLGFGSVLGELEFRIEGLQGTQFLVGGFSTYFPPRLDTTNRFRVDLSNPNSPIRVATKAAWDNATVVPITRDSRLMPANAPPDDKPLAFDGFLFDKSGELWEQFRLSPDQAWLVLQSGARVINQGPSNMFFDVFSADTGNKIVTIKGTFSSEIGAPPEDVLSKTGWVTERYFIVPLGKRVERCLVCEFGRQRNGGSKN